MVLDMISKTLLKDFEFLKSKIVLKYLICPTKVLCKYQYLIYVPQRHEHERHFESPCFIGCH